MTTTDELLRSAEQHAAAFHKGDRPLPPQPGGSPSSPAWTHAWTPHGCSALEEGDAHVIRNAGGAVTQTPCAR